LQFPISNQTFGICFAALWAAVVVVVFFIFRMTPPEKKQRLHNAIAVVLGLILLFAVFLFSNEQHSYYFISALIVILTVMATRTIKHCWYCGAMNRNPFMLTVPRFCQKCGSPLFRRRKRRLPRADSST